MNATQLIELINTTPFKPLEFHLNNGASIVVEHPYQIATRRNSPTCIIYDDDDHMHVVALRNITEIITKSISEA